MRKVNGLENWDEEDGFDFARAEADFETIERLAKLIRLRAEDNLGHEHVTARGRRIPIYEMADEHLLNTIRYHSERIADSIKAHADFSGPVTMLDAIMKGKKNQEVQVDTVKALISAGYTVLGSYIVEGLRRRMLEETYSAASAYFHAIDSLAAVDTTGAALPAPKGGDNESQ